MLIKASPYFRVQFCFVVFLFLKLVFVPSIFAQNQNFQPPEEPIQIHAVFSESGIILDGNIGFEEWENSGVFSEFIQLNPDPLSPSISRIEARIQYNERYLFVSAKIEIPKNETIKVTNLSRNYRFNDNTEFGFALDTSNDKRNAVAFHCSAGGNKRDLQVSDGTFINDNWNALWFCASNIDDAHWSVEMAIPWRSLRYSSEKDYMSIILIYNNPATGEFVSLPAVPHVLGPYQMSFAASLTGLELPESSSNIQVVPYIFSSYSSKTESQAESSYKTGGEIKWASSNNTILDVTFNTDFAQADADIQTVNLTQFSILFPEKRQFFLENANVFRPNVTDFIMPFFSRRIGLDNNGNPIPINVGLRLVQTNATRNYGLLLMHQAENVNNSDALFGVARYNRNFGRQNRFGGMITHRQNGLTAGVSTSNTTYSIDGMFRPNPYLSFNAMVSLSSDSELGEGIATQLWTSYRRNWLYAGLISYYVVDYHPGIGLERFGRNYAFNSPAISFDLRPDWLPHQILRYTPSISAVIYNSADFSSLLIAEFYLRLIEIELRNGVRFRYQEEFNWQNIERDRFFIGVPIQAGSYYYNRRSFELQNRSAELFSWFLKFSHGGFFDRNLTTYQTILKLNPSRYFSYLVDYSSNKIYAKNTSENSKHVYLVSNSMIVSLSPTLQLSGLYQKNSANSSVGINLRASWEFRPLSNIYLIYNSNYFEKNEFSPSKLNQQGIFKISYLMQF